jgi:hypothetical protein
MIEDMAIRKPGAKTQHDYVQRLGKQMTFIYEPRKVPIVLSPDEVERFLEAAPGLSGRACVACGPDHQLVNRAGGIKS